MRRVDLLYFKTQAIKDIKDLKKIYEHLDDVADSEGYRYEIYDEIITITKNLSELIDAYDSLIHKIYIHCEEYNKEEQSIVDGLARTVAGHDS